MSTPPAPTVLDALSLAAQAADELVVGTVRDTHRAWADRFHRHGASARIHRAVAGGVYGGLGLGLRGASQGLGAAGRTGLGPALESGRPGRFLNAAVNGLIGDRLREERPRLAIELAVRHHRRDVALTPDALAAAHPGAGARLVVFLHGLCESEEHWDRRRELRGTTYAETLAGAGWTPLMLRGNTGLGLRENGVALTSLLQRVVDAWPVPVERIALVGHSMGGLVMRAAAAVAAEHPAPWATLVTDVVTLGTPHHGAPLAGGVGRAATVLARMPESAAFGRILDWRSVGVHDLVVGLGADVPALPNARYRLVSATLTRTPRHPVGAFLGDILVRQPSAYGRRRGQAALFPDADVLHLPRAHHFTLLNDERVEQALLGWLSPDC